MKFVLGIGLLTDPSHAIPLAVEAEKSGFDALQVGDSLFYPKESQSVYPYYETKRSFLQKNPEIPAYLSWLAPNFRLRVGDLRTRLEAEKLLHEMRLTYPGSYIVPDEIESAGLATLHELGSALDRFRAAGKDVVAVVGDASQAQYLLVSHADKILLDPYGLSQSAKPPRSMGTRTESRFWGTAWRPRRHRGPRRPRRSASCSSRCAGRV